MFGVVSRHAPYHRDTKRGTAISAPEVHWSLATQNQSHSFVHPATREERNRRDNKDEGKEDQRNVQKGTEENEEVGGAVVPVTETTAESGGARHLLEQTHLRKVTASCNQCVEFRVAQRVPVPWVLVCDTGMNE